MLKFTPILLAILTGLGMWFFSSWRLRRELDRKAARLTDPVLAAHAARFAEVLGLDELRVHVYDTPAVNGLASPDGRIFITRGFLERYRRGLVSSEELASVIAHELGHVALGHTRRRMIDFAGANTVRFVLAVILGRLIPFFGVMLADLIASVVVAGLSRKDEYEADAWAAALMTKSGLGTGPQKSLLLKIGREGPHGAAPAWLLSHPKVEDRVGAIETLEARWSSVPPPGPG
jgi:putative metalloprotease